MNIELNHPDTVHVDEQITYTFVVDVDLAHVGGGSATVDY